MARTSVMRLGTLSLIVAIVFLPLGAVLAFHSPLGREEEGEVRVETSHNEYEAGETIRIVLRNVGDNSLSGAPRILVLNAAGGIVQSFAPGSFQYELEPGEAVWVDWATSPRPIPCEYGTMDRGGDAEARGSYPCPMMNDMSGGASSTAPSYYPIPGLVGEFVIVGVFGTHADASTIRIHGPAAR